MGTLPPFTDQPCRSYGSWSDGYDVYLQIRWQAIPEERRRAFKVAMDSDEQTEIGGIPVKVSSHRVMDQYAPFDSALELRLCPASPNSSASGGTRICWSFCGKPPLLMK